MVFQQRAPWQMQPDPYNEWLSQQPQYQGIAQRPVFGTPAPSMNPAIPPQQTPGPTLNWGQVPNAQESAWSSLGGPPQFSYQQAAPAAPPTTLAQPTSALAGVVNGQARTGLPETGAPGIASAPVVGEVTPATTAGGWAPPNYDANKWRETAAGAIRNGWGLDPQGARQNNGIYLGNGVVLIMPTDYNYAADTYRAQVAGAGVENGMQRAIRWTADEMSGNPGLNPMQVFAKNIRRVMQESGGKAGFNMAQMGGQGMGADAGAHTPAQGAPPPTAVGAPPTVPAPVAPAVPAAPATPGAPTAGSTGGTGNTSAAQRQAMIDDRTGGLAYKYMMQQMGVDPTKPGLLARFMERRFKPLLLARMAAGEVGDNATYGDTVDQLIAEFGRGATQKGGNFFGNLRNIGTQAAGAGGSFLDGLKDQEAAPQYLAQLGMLRYAGSNPLVQQAMADQMENAASGYEDYGFADVGNNNSFLEWLRQQSKYKGIYGF